MNEKALTRTLHTGATATVIFAGVALCTLFGIKNGLIIPFGIEPRGLFTQPEQWLPAGEISFFLNLSVIGICAYLLAFLTREYNPFRLHSAVAATLFIVMIAGEPSALADFYSGSLLLAVVAGCVMLLLSVYQNPEKTRRIFLVSFILTTASLFQLSILAYFPVMLIGVGQMKIFCGRTLTAMLLGLITPFWILAGIGFFQGFSFDTPSFNTVFTAFTSDDIIPVIVAAGITFFIGLVMLLLNILKIVGYNARIRSAAGLITVTLVTTMTLAVVDFTNLPVYIPLLCWGTAFHSAYYLMSRNGIRTYIPVLCFIILYAYLFIWNIME